MLDQYGCFLINLALAALAQTTACFLRSQKMLMMPPKLSIEKARLALRHLGKV